MAVLGVVVISGCMLFMDFVSKEKFLMYSIMDYVDNYFSNKLAQDYKDKEGQIPPEQDKRALQEVAAAGGTRRKKRSSQYYYNSYPESEPDYQNDDVDAKIVEDVLKEFLC